MTDEWTTLEQEWDKFASHFIPSNASQAQHRDMKLAFFCGIATMIKKGEQLGEDELLEESCIKLDTIREECVAFLHDEMDEEIQKRLRQN